MPSVSEKQRRFMGAELGRKRSGEKTQTGMSEKQLSEFAGGVKKHGSLADIDFHEEAAFSDVLCPEFTHPVHKKTSASEPVIWGALDPPDIDGAAPQFTKGRQSANRDAGQGIHYGATIDHFGPDTDYRAEEIDVHQYGRDHEPIPLRDYYKTVDDQFERGFRMREQDKYDETATPGTVTDEQPMSEAYGAVNYQGAGPDGDNGKKAGDCDNRSFESQRRYARTNKDKSQEYAVDISGLDTKEGKDIE